MTIRFRTISTQNDVTFPLKVILSSFEGFKIPEDTYTFSRNFMKSATAQQLLDTGIEAYEYVPAVIEPSTDPVDYPLNAVQFFAMLEILGKTEAVDTAIDAIPDTTEKAVAKAKFKHSVEFNRDDPLFAALAPVVGLTAAEIDTAWMAAKEIR
ncbi:MAG: hypothetical protein COA52_00920 [Hyphomicrobiales bacterium]|nr:MAG: hypothetical protein COA52_00920 [Hyphomicrobiales bacterium]